MRKFYLMFLLLCSSCSASWYLKKAIQKDPSIITVSHDTIIKPGETIYKDTMSLDSIVIRENNLFIRVDKVRDSVSLRYMYTPQTTVIHSKEVLNIPKPRYVVKQEQKTQRAQIRNKRKETVRVKHLIWVYLVVYILGILTWLFIQRLITKRL